MEKELIEKMKLFIEYLKHEEKLTYTKIADVMGIGRASVSQHSFSYATALKALRRVNACRPNWIEKFDKYYGYKIVKVPHRGAFGGNTKREK